jgi:hypothetical protein
MRVRGPDQLNLLLSPPSFKLLLTVDCLSHLIRRFPVKKSIDMVLAGKPTNGVLFVLINALFWTGGHANV